MKKIITIAIILLLSTSGWARENKQNLSLKVVELENRINALEGQQKLFDSAIEVNRKNAEADFNSKLNEIKKENRVMEVIASILVLIGIAVIVSAIYQLFWGFKKAIEKKTTELKDKLQVEFEKQAETAKQALNEAIKMSGIEIDLKKCYRLNILYNGSTKENLERLCNMLQGFGFSCITHNQIEPSLLNKFDIILFYDDTNISLTKIDDQGKAVATNRSKWLSEQLSKDEILKLRDLCGFFFINKTGLLHNFKEKDIDCFSSANSFATMYENLMSLLHYKRYLNNK